MSKPVAVITGDVHFTPGTLSLAVEAIKQVFAKAEHLGVPAILNGDTLDSKAIIRAECANDLIHELIKTKAQVIINTGNHDLINEKSVESSLTFLTPYAEVVNSVRKVPEIGSYIIPYYSNSSVLEQELDRIPRGSRLIMHQGVIGADLGHYVQDKTSLPKEAFEDFRVIASHYHKRQDIKCGRPRKGAVGLFSYIGNPYSLSFGEADHGPKGYSILMDDGLLEFVPTNLRKHVVYDIGVDRWWEIGKQDPSDLLWLKVDGPTSELAKLNKIDVANVVGHSNFKLEKIYTDAPKLQGSTENLTDAQVLDCIIDATDESPEQKQALKDLWREVI